MGVPVHGQPSPTALHVPPPLSNRIVGVVTGIKVIGPGRIVEDLLRIRSIDRLACADEFLLTARTAKGTGKKQHRLEAIRSAGGLVQQAATGKALK